MCSGYRTNHIWTINSAIASIEASKEAMHVSMSLVTIGRLYEKVAAKSVKLVGLGSVEHVAATVRDGIVDARDSPTNLAISLRTLEC